MGEMHGSAVHPSPPTRHPSSVRRCAIRAPLNANRLLVRLPSYHAGQHPAYGESIVHMYSLWWLDL